MQVDQLFFHAASADVVPIKHAIRDFNGIVKDIKESLISGKMWYSILTPYGIVDEFEESRIEELNDPKAQG